MHAALVHDDTMHVNDKLHRINNVHDDGDDGDIDGAEIMLALLTTLSAVQVRACGPTPHTTRDLTDRPWPRGCPSGCSDGSCALDGGRRRRSGAPP